MLNFIPFVNLKLADALPFAHASIHSCFLCDSLRLHVIGGFLPDRPELWSEIPVRPGKTRAFFYGLCRRCLRKARKSNGAVIENKLLSMQSATLH